MNKLNASILKQFPGDEVVYPSADFFEPGDAETEGDAETYPPEFLNQLEPNGFSVHRLALKVGAPVHRRFIFVVLALHLRFRFPGVDLHQKPVSQDRADERHTGRHHAVTQALCWNLSEQRTDGRRGHLPATHQPSEYRTGQSLVLLDLNHNPIVRH